MNRENKVKGQKYRILVDSINKVWDRVSFWTAASDVEFDDGTTLQTYYSNNKTWVGTQAEYDAITTKDSSTFYYIKKETTTTA